MQRDAAFRSDASGTPRATKVLNISYFFTILSNFSVTLGVTYAWQNISLAWKHARPQDYKLTSCWMPIPAPKIISRKAINLRIGSAGNRCTSNAPPNDPTTITAAITRASSKFRFPDSQLPTLANAAIGNCMAWLRPIAVSTGKPRKMMKARVIKGRPSRLLPNQSR